MARTLINKTAILANAAINNLDTGVFQNTDASNGMKILNSIKEGRIFLYLKNADSTGTAAAVVLTPDTGKTLTVTSAAAVGADSEVISVAMTTAADDNLAVTKSDTTGVITIAVANTTASKNTAALIQAAIRALTTVKGITVTGWTVAANAAYVSAPVTAATLEAAALSGGENAAKVVTIQSGDYPRGSLGDLAVTVPSAGERIIGPLESARFEQADGYFYVDIDGATSTTIAAFYLP